MRGFPEGSMLGQSSGVADSERAGQIDEQKSWLQLDMQALKRRPSAKSGDNARVFIAVNEEWW